ncbi:hypothetical protein HUJ05_001643, partial [Dendroctonus ponderosae]
MAQTEAKINWDLLKSKLDNIKPYDGDLSSLNKFVKRCDNVIATYREFNDSDLDQHIYEKVYEKAYQNFKNYIRAHTVQVITENVLLAYMGELSSKNLKSSTLWSIYSMLNATLNTKKNVDISKFTKLRAFLKKQNVGYLPKKSRILTRVNQFERFLGTAPDQQFLMHKVGGLYLWYRYTHLETKHIEDLGKVLLIKISHNKTNKPRSFT